MALFEEGEKGSRGERVKGKRVINVTASPFSLSPLLPFPRLTVSPRR
jgi:hypothetical protein